MNKNLAQTALVTGGTGFIGRHLVNKLLSENIRVRVLIRSKSIHADRMKGLDVEIIHGDLKESLSIDKALKGVNTIYHVAGVMSDNQDLCYRVNTKGTEHLIRAALAANVERFVYLSDIEVYDIEGAKKGEIIKEDWPCHKNPQQMGSYIHSIIEAEKLIFDAHHNHGLKATVLRSSMVIGPMGKMFFPQLGYQFRDKTFLVIRKGANILPLIYYENLVKGLYKASIEEKAIGRIYNLVDEPNITVRSYIEQFIRITGSEARIVFLPYFIPYFGIAVYEFVSYTGLLKKGGTSRSRFRWKHAPVLFDNSKAKKDLNLNQGVSIEEGLTRTFKWYKDQLRNKREPLN